MQKKRPKYMASQVAASSWHGFMLIGFFSFFVNFGVLASPLYMQQIFDRVMQSQHLETLLYLTVITFFFLAIVAVLDGIRGSILAKIAKWWDESVHGDLLTALVQTSRSKGVANTYAVNDLMTIRQFVGSPSVLPFFDGPWMPLFIVAIALIHPWLGLIAAVTACILIIVAVFNDWVTRRRMEGVGTYQSRAQNTVNIATRHADSIYSMGMLPGMLARYTEDNTKVAGIMHDVATFSSKTSAFSRFLRFTAQVSVLGLGAYLATKAEITAGGMIAASIIMGRALAPAEQAMSAWRSFVGARQAHHRLQDLFESAPVDEDTLQLPAPEGLLTFNRASYVVRGVEKPILQNLTMTIQPGSVVGIVGPSGSGKSTLCRMLIGAANPTSGSIRLDATSLQNWNKTQLSQHIGYLAQSVDLLNGTVKENIARLETDCDDDVVAAAKLAGCHDMISKLPQGYETVIGDTDQKLSGGQRQRIGLARALFRVPKLIVLDEPNSNLDHAGESALIAAISELKQLNSTVILVSHRAAAVASVDNVVTLVDGAIDKVQSREEVLRNALRPIEEKINNARRNTQRTEEPNAFQSLPEQKA